MVDVAIFAVSPEHAMPCHHLSLGIGILQSPLTVLETQMPQIAFETGIYGKIIDGGIELKRSDIHKMLSRFEQLPLKNDKKSWKMTPLISAYIAIKIPQGSGKCQGRQLHNKDNDGHVNC